MNLNLKSVKFNKLAFNFRPFSLSPFIHDHKLNTSALSGCGMHGETNGVHLVPNPFIISCQDWGNVSSLSFETFDTLWFTIR